MCEFMNILNVIPTAAGIFATSSEILIYHRRGNSEMKKTKQANKQTESNSEKMNRVVSWIPRRWPNGDSQFLRSYRLQPSKSHDVKRCECRPGWRRMSPRIDVVLPNVTQGDLRQVNYHGCCSCRSLSASMIFTVIVSIPPALDPQVSLQVAQIAKTSQRTRSRSEQM